MVDRSLDHTFKAVMAAAAPSDNLVTAKRYSVVVSSSGMPELRDMRGIEELWIGDDYNICINVVDGAIHVFESEKARDDQPNKYIMERAGKGEDAKVNSRDIQVTRAF